jgi:CheY-like chemotaxis protein
MRIILNKSDFFILIVDDEKDLLEMYKDFLESEGYKILTAFSGENAIDVFNKNQEIALIISDSHMGKMSGLELLAQLKSKSESLPHFYLATGDIDKSEADLKLLGVSRLIIKPFDLTDVIKMIDKDLNVSIE